MWTDKYYKNPDLQSWTKNPRFNIAFEGTSKAKVTVTLAIADKNWRGKVAASKKLKDQEQLKDKQENGSANRIARLKKSSEDVEAV